MGITGLLPLVNSVTRDGHIKQYSGKKVAVDAYGWLHKGSYGCSSDLALGKPTTVYIEFCMQRVKMMQFHGVIPVLVFDGRSLPMKSGTDKERSIRRKEYLAKGKAYWENGNKTLAFECFQKCTDVTPEMAHAFIQVLKVNQIEYMVAPYEADAQLAFLARSERVHAVVTEDSDLIVFGCPRIFVKMDRDGIGKEVILSHLGDLTEINCTGWRDDTFRQMCILSGCDYLSSVHGIGLKTAHKLLRQFKTPEAIITHLKSDKKKYNVPDNYLYQFKKAEMTFRYQRVYDPTSKTLIMLNPWDNRGIELLEEVMKEGTTLSLGLDTVTLLNTQDQSIPLLANLHLNDPLGWLDFIGASLPSDIAHGIALGDINPHTLLPMTLPISSARLTLESRLSSSSASASAKLVSGFLHNANGIKLVGSQDLTTHNPFIDFFTRQTRPIDGSSLSLTIKKEEDERIAIEERVNGVRVSIEGLVEGVIEEVKVEALGVIGGDRVEEERDRVETVEGIVHTVEDALGLGMQSSESVGKSSMENWMTTLKSQYSHPLGLEEEKHVKRARSARADLNQLIQGGDVPRLTLKRSILSPETPPSNKQSATSVLLSKLSTASSMKTDEDQKDRLMLSDKLAQFKYKTLCMSVLNK